MFLPACHHTPVLHVTDQYGCYITKMIYTPIMVNGHIGLTDFYISTKIQATTTDTSHIISKYVQKKYAPQKPNICHIG